MAALTTASLGPSVPRSSKAGSPFKYHPHDGDSLGAGQAWPSPLNPRLTQSTRVSHCPLPLCRPSQGLRNSACLQAFPISAPSAPPLPPQSCPLRVDPPPFPLLTPTPGGGVSTRDPLCASHSSTPPESQSLLSRTRLRAPSHRLHPATLLPARPPQGSPQRGPTPHRGPPAQSPQRLLSHSWEKPASFPWPLGPRPSAPSPPPNLVPNLFPTLPPTSQPLRPYSGQVASTPFVPSDYYNTCENCRQGVMAHSTMKTLRWRPAGLPRIPQSDMELGSSVSPVCPLSGL